MKIIKNRIFYLLKQTFSSYDMFFCDSMISPKQNTAFSQTYANLTRFSFYKMQLYVIKYPIQNRRQVYRSTKNSGRLQDLNEP